MECSGLVAISSRTVFPQSGHGGCFSGGIRLSWLTTNLYRLGSQAVRYRTTSNTRARKGRIRGMDPGLAIYVVLCLALGLMGLEAVDYGRWRWSLAGMLK